MTSITHTTSLKHGSLNEHGELVHEGDVCAQLALSMANVESELATAGLNLADVDRLVVYTTDIDATLAAYGAVVERLTLAGAAPPATVLGVTCLAIPGMAVEIEVFPTHSTPLHSSTKTGTETGTGTTMTMTSTDLDLDLAATVAGPVLTPGLPGYAEEVAGFNLAHVPSPAVVVGATCEADVAAAIAYAGRAGLRLRVQATGHGLVDNLDATLLVTTHRLDGIAIDPAAQTATIGAGVRWRAVIDAAAPYGLAPLCGSASGVGAVGYTLGGGTGILSRRYGFAADHVRSLTVVTGDGTVRQVDATSESELFWAIRGGKVGFGIVTELVVDLVPVARFYGGGLFFPGASAGDVIRAWKTWSATLPNEVTTSVAMLRLPPDPHLPPPLQGAFVTHLRYADLGEPDQAETRLAPMRTVAPVLFDTIGELPFVAVDAVHMDPPMPVPAHDRGLTLTDLPEAAIDALIATNGEGSDSGLVLVDVRLMGGALSEPASVPNAVPGRDSAYIVHVLGIPAGPAAGTVPAQADRVVSALEPWRAGALPNFLGHAGPGSWAQMWSGTDRDRLRAVARRYDPADVLGGEEILSA